MSRTRSLKILGAVLLVMIMSLLSNSVPAAGRGHAYGTLTSIESDGTVVIDGRGYLLSSSAAIQDYRGERISLRSLSLPDVVYYEFVYEPRGFVITLIKQTPQ